MVDPHPTRESADQTPQNQDQLNSYVGSAFPALRSTRGSGITFESFSDRGFFTAHDARTGKEIYTKVRLDPAAGAFTASPWAYNGKLFAMSEDGVTYVIQAGPEFKVLATNKLIDSNHASPAIAGGRLYLAGDKRLFAIGKK